VDEKVNCLAIQKVEEPLYIGEQRIQLFHLKIQIKKTKVDCIADLESQVNFIS